MSSSSSLSLISIWSLCSMFFSNKQKTTTTINFWWVCQSGVFTLSVCLCLWITFEMINENFLFQTKFYMRKTMVRSILIIKWFRSRVDAIYMWLWMMKHFTMKIPRDILRTELTEKILFFWGYWLVNWLNEKKTNWILFTYVDYHLFYFCR